MKPFRRTDPNVPLHCPLPKCRARGSWGTFPRACFSCFVLFASSKENEVALAKPAAQFMMREEKVEPRSGRAGPPFSVRPKKEAKGAVLHGTSAAERFSHDPTRSANLHKLSRSRGFRHMGRFVFALQAKIPSRATQLMKRYAASAFRKLLEPQAAGSASDLRGTIIFSQEPVA